MSTISNNYNLVKPDITDFYDVTKFNDNFDTIDEQMKKNERLVAEVTLDTAASSITIDDLDINADGGVYEIVVTCCTQEPVQFSNYYIEYNGISSSSDYHSKRALISDAYTVENSAAAGICMPTATYNKHTISLPFNYPTCFTEMVYYGLGVSDGNGGHCSQNYHVQQSNITNIKLKMVNYNFAVGTVVKIFKR